MSGYFPFSHIILNICNNVRKNITGHSYFSEWSAYEQLQPVSQTGVVAISEIYY